MTTPQTYLVCPPDHFEVAYEINPWMSVDGRVDHGRAREEWDRFCAELERAGARLVHQPAQPGLPDLVFTANAAFVCNGRALLSRFTHHQRQGETPHDAAVLAEAGLEIVELPADAGAFEGTGDAIIFDDVVFCGHGHRTDEAALPHIEAFAGAPVIPVRLVDDRFYHLDIVVCPLDADRRALVAPNAMDEASLRRVLDRVPEPILLTDDEAMAFCANSVVVNDTILMHHVPERLGRRLAQEGFEVRQTPVPEFLKAGGSLRCLSLRLDAVVPVSAAPAPG